MAVKTIAAASAEALTLKAGQTLRIIDPMGGQSGDVIAFREGDITEWLSNGRTFDYGGAIYMGLGATLYSNRSNPMLTIVRDDVGRHDFLYAPCSEESYRLQHGLENHPNCLSNLAGALAHIGIGTHLVPTPFNFFMDASADAAGRLAIRPAKSKPGDAVELRAEMDLVLAVSACPSAVCNGDGIKPVQYEILG